MEQWHNLDVSTHISGDCQYLLKFLNQKKGGGEEGSQKKYLSVGQRSQKTNSTTVPSLLKILAPHTLCQVVRQQYATQAIHHYKGISTSADTELIISMTASSMSIHGVNCVYKMWVGLENKYSMFIFIACWTWHMFW